jgi:hypothetical protein
LRYRWVAHPVRTIRQRDPFPMIMTSSTPLKGFGIRAAMVYVALIAVMNPVILGFPAAGISRVLAPVSHPFAALVGLPGFPLQGEFVFRILVALVGGGIWWALARDRTDDGTMWQALLVEIRYVLAAGLIWFGLGHLLGVITPFPSQADWIRPLREMDAPHFMTVWVGTSWLHKLSLGASHIVAGLALLSRRTALFGTFLGVSVVGNEALTTFSFGDFRSGDYWVFFELALLASVLVLVDGRRLIDAVSFNTRTVSPPAPEPHWPPGWLSKLAHHARPAVLALLLIANLPTILRGFDNISHSPIAGVYRVETYSLNGRDSLTADEATDRWVLVAIDHCSRFAARTVDGRQLEGAIKLPERTDLAHRRNCVKATSGNNGTLTLVAPDSLPPATIQPPLAGTVQFTRTQTGFDLHVKLEHADIVAKLRRVPDSAFTQFEFLGEGW